MSDVIVAALVLLSSWIGVAPPETPRDRYARHTYQCPHCKRLGADLCPAGEDLRRKARDADGLRDPALDR